MKLWLDGKVAFRYFYSLRCQKPLSHVNSTWASQQGCAANHTAPCKVLPHLCKAILLQLFLYPLWRQFKGCNFLILTSLPCSLKSFNTWDLPHWYWNIKQRGLHGEELDSMILMGPFQVTPSSVKSFHTSPTFPYAVHQTFITAQSFPTSWLSSHGSILTPSPLQESAPKCGPSPFQSCLCASGQWEVWRDLPASSASCPRPLRSGAPAPAGLHSPTRKGSGIRLHILTTGNYYCLNAQTHSFWGEILSSSQEVWGKQG